MADFGGFQVQTPQEVLAGLNQQRMAIASMSNPRAQRNANIAFQLQNLAGSPELRRAKRLEANMKQVEATVPRTGDALQDERTRLSMMFDAVKDLDPLAASQISQQMLALDTQAFERKRLQAASDRADRNTDIQERNASINEKRFMREPNFSDYRWIIDPNDPKAKPKMLDLRDPAMAAEYDKSAQEGMTALTQDQAYELLGFHETRQQMKDIINRSGFEKKIEGYNAQFKFLDQGRKLIERFRRDPRTGTFTLDVMRGINNVVEEGQAFVKTLEARDGSTFNEKGTRAYISGVLDDLEKKGDLEFQGNQRSLYESAVLNMGYVLARSLDSGGRLSDQDVNMAIRMLTGGSTIFEDGTISVPAEQITSVMLDRASDINDILGVNSVDEALFSQEAAEMGSLQAQQMRDIRALGRVRYDQFVESATEILGEDGVREVVDPYSLPTREEEIATRAEALREERNASELAKLADNPSTPIFRADRQAERDLPRGAAILYNADGSIVRILDNPTQMANAMRAARPGQRIRFKDGSGNIQEPNLQQ